MSARKRWTEPGLPIGPTDLALVAEQWEAPTGGRTPRVDEPTLYDQAQDRRDTLRRTLPLEPCE